MSEYHARRSRVLTRMANLYPDVYADLMALERVNDGLDPAPTYAPIAKCGTRPGYYRHRRKDEPTCELCKKAVRDYSRERNQARAAKGKS